MVLRRIIFGGAHYLVCAAALIGALAGNTLATESLTLVEARRLALERNADLRIAQTQVDAALAMLRSAKEFPNPNVGFSVSKINTDHRTNQTALGNRFFDRSYDSIVLLSQFFELGKRGVRQTAAREGLNSAESLRDDARRLLIQAITQAYIAVLAADEQVRVLLKSAESLRKEASIASARLKAGDISSSDQAQLEIAAAQLELSAASAQAMAHTAVVVVETLLAEPNPNGETKLVDKIDQLPNFISSGNETPGEARPDIVAAEATVKSAEANLKLQKRGNTPDLTLAVQWEHQPPDQPNTVGFGLSFPIPLWNRNQGNILAAKANRDQAQVQLSKIQVQASADVASARVACKEAKERAARYLHELQPKSADIVKSISYAYSKGGASLVDLLQAERNDNDIRLATAQAQTDNASAAIGLATALNRLDALMPR